MAATRAERDAQAGEVEVAGERADQRHGGPFDPGDEEDQHIDRDGHRQEGDEATEKILGDAFHGGAGVAMFFVIPA